MYKIDNVSIIEYYSQDISPDILENFLIGSTCNYKGKLELILKPGRELIQRGPYILPPIRWLEGFEYNAEFHIVCDVNEHS